MTADNSAERDIRLSQTDVAKILGHAIELGSEITGIARFGYPTFGGGLEKAIVGLKPYRQALEQTLEVALKPYDEKPWVKKWVMRFVEIEPKVLTEPK